MLLFLVTSLPRSVPSDQTDNTVGNGCSATQFVPIMANGSDAVKKITQFSRQAQYLSERENPQYSSLFKATMRYIPLAMRLYRATLYWQMERDYSGFDIEGGKHIREDLKRENDAYVKRVAPSKYWDALIPRTEIGCKRKVLDTEYLASLHKKSVELVSADGVEKITETGVQTKSGKEVDADAIILATGFATQQMLFPMEILGRHGVSLNRYVSHRITKCRHTLIVYWTVEYRDPVRCASILRNMRSFLPQLLHHDGSQYRHRPSLRNLHCRMPNQLHPAPPRSHHPNPTVLPLALPPLPHAILPSPRTNYDRSPI